MNRRYLTRHGRSAAPARVGYVLVLTLVILAIAASVSVTASLWSLRRSTEAVEAQEELQLRWGTLSLNKAVLSQAETLLQRQESLAGKSLASVRNTIRLGTVEFSLLLGDEQAKANVNTLIDRYGWADTRRIIAGLISHCPSPPQVNLPAPTQLGPTVSGAAKAPISSLGQVFAQDVPQMLLGSRQRGPCPAEYVTCWGSGRLNVPRADPRVRRAVLAPLANPSVLDQVLRQFADAGLEAAADGTDGLQMRKVQRQQLDRAITSSSGCHSLWIMATAGRRTWYRLTVSGPGIAGAADECRFEW